MKVLRCMRADEDGLPMTGTTGRYLAARPSGRRRDIDVGAAGMVYPGTGGMSVIPPPVTNIHELIRPPEHGGKGKDPVYELDTEDLPRELLYRPTPGEEEKHGYIEPAWEMSFEEYQAALYGTRELWRLH